jgi:predicted RNase H-like nuclease (RuvC/YqgF family)
MTASLTTASELGTDDPRAARLQTEIAALRRDNKRLRAENAKLKAAVEQLETSVGVKGPTW